MPETTFQFDVTPEGLLHETAVNEMVTKLKETFPGTDDLALEAHLMLGLTDRYLAEVSADFRAKFGITGRRFTVLRLLYLAEGKRMSMGTIAANLDIGTNNTTQLIDGLVKDGLVERLTAPEDKRVIYAVLSDEGARLFAYVFPMNAERIRQTWAPLSVKEKQVLIHLLARLRLNLVSIPDAAEPLIESGELTSVRLAPEANEQARTRRRPRPRVLSQPTE
jgi:MarR family 2-MHQ and catechol resistance regulon transcriptional repressor